jgi:hypothetical protein
MEQWWERHSHVHLNGHQKKDVEELTGCVPLLLNRCVVDGKIDFEPLEDVAIKAADFTRKTKQKTKDVNNFDDWNLYVQHIPYLRRS